MIQIAMTLALSVAIAVMALQSCSQASTRMEAVAGLVAYTEAIRQFRQANCTELPTTVSETQLRSDDWLTAPLPNGTTWVGVFTEVGAIDVTVSGDSSPEADRALITIAASGNGLYQGGQVGITVTPVRESALSGAGFIRKQHSYPWRECGY